MVQNYSKISTRVCTLTNPLQHLLERIRYEALDGHECSVSIGRRPITNFRFANDIVVNEEEKEEADILVDRLDTTTTRYKIEIGPDNTKVMTNNPNGFQRNIKINGQRLEEVENFKVKTQATIRNRHNQIPHPALKTKREITKYIN